MKIEVINKKRKELSGVMEIPDGYPVPEGRQIMESQDYRKGKEFYEERKCIHLDGVNINFFKKSWAHQQEVSVRSDGPYIQMHFELSGGAAYYHHNDTQFTVPTAQGEFSMFYMPQLDGTLIDPPCSNATSLEIELSRAWLLEHIGHSPVTASDFVKGITSSRPTLLGGKSYSITPFISHTINSLRNCPYTGNIQRLYTEGKLLELLALQLQQADTTETMPRRHVLTKQDVERLHFLKEKITADPSKSYTIQELSYLTFMNRTKMQAGFRELFGCTIHQFIVENRMTEAYRLLTDDYSNHWNISEIARRVGYRYCNHFSIAFKKRFGVPPSWFLKK
ncbi:helix-turn-helix domain-containing protein [Sinomicrobium sp. M5D2P17]